MREGLAAWLATGGYLFRPYYLGLLAEACGKAGQVEEGLRLLAEARAVERVNDFDTAGGRSLGSEFWFL